MGVSPFSGSARCTTRPASRARWQASSGSITGTISSTRGIGGSPLSLLYPILFLNGRSDQRPVFGPGTVVVLHVPVAPQLGQGEPGVGGALADPAVGDDLLVPCHARPAVQPLELVGGLERAVLVGRLGPRDVGRPRDVPRDLC